MRDDGSRGRSPHQPTGSCGSQSRASVERKIMSDEAEVIHHGLDGVVVDTTSISKVMPEINSLVYRGYPVQELAEHCSFEETAWLIWHGELPDAKQLAEFMTV